MSAGPPRPRPWAEGVPKVVGDDGVRRLTAPVAFRVYCGVLGYHAPRRLQSAQTIYDGMAQVR